MYMFMEKLLNNCIFIYIYILLIQKEIDEICHNKNIPLYSVDCFGFNGILVADLSHFEYAEYLYKLLF